MENISTHQLFLIAEHNLINNNLDIAKNVLEQILKEDPSNSKANELQAYLLFRAGKTELAFAFLKTAVRSPNCTHEALYEYGSYLLEQSEFDEASTCFLRSIEKAGDYFEALHDLGTAYAQMGFLDKSLDAYKRALALKKDSPELFYNLGRLFDEILNPQAALECYKKATAISPNFAEAWHNLGLTLRELKHYAESLSYLEKAFKLDPELNFLEGDILGVKMQMASWIDLDKSLCALTDKINLDKTLVAPFNLLALTDSPQLHLQAAKHYCQHKFIFNPLLGPFFKQSQKKKIKLAYFSADFRNHATSILIAELIELHDKNQFEIIGFSFGPAVQDEMYYRLKNSFSQLLEVGKQSDIEIAKLSRSLDIDIAIDLKGYTQGSRPGIFSYRAAPIQISYLGYPGTLGANYVDYIIADKTLIPPELQQYYLEKIIYLPNSYQVNDRKRLISDKLLTKEQLGLPANGFIFCCFNKNYKITSVVFASWMRILNKVHGSVLWLFDDNPMAVENLRQETLRYRIDPNRLIFAKEVSLPDHLARHGQADLFLDTLPYNAHTTTSDALWAGLPVLTLIGSSFASRVSASLLNAVGLQELITNTIEDYEELAIELACNQKKLAEIRKTLTTNRLKSALFDTPLFTKNIEAAYLKVHQRYHLNLIPENMFIT